MVGKVINLLGRVRCIFYEHCLVEDLEMCPKMVGVPSALFKHSLWLHFLCVSNRFIEIEFTYHIIHPFIAYNLMVFSMFTGLCSHHHSQFWNIFIMKVRNPVSLGMLSLPPHCLALRKINLTLNLWICLLQRFYMSGIQTHDFICT